MSLFTTSGALLNRCGEKVTIFSIEDNCNIKIDDLVVVNARTLQASKVKKESGYISVGRAIQIITNEFGHRYVICKDGLYELKNSKKWEHSVSQYSEGHNCYFEDENTVSLNNINTTKAGEVVQVFKKKVIVRIDVNQEVQPWH